MKVVILRERKFTKNLKNAALVRSIMKRTRQDEKGAQGHVGK